MMAIIEKGIEQVMPYPFPPLLSLFQTCVQIDRQTKANTVFQLVQKHAKYHRDSCVCAPQQPVKKQCIDIFSCYSYRQLDKFLDRIPLRRLSPDYMRSVGNSQMKHERGRALQLLLNTPSVRLGRWKASVNTTAIALP